MKIGILIALRQKEEVYNNIKTAVEQGFDNGQISVWDMSLYCDEVIEQVKQACKDFSFTVTAVWCGWSGPTDWSYPNMYTTLGLIPSDWRAIRTQDLLKGAWFADQIGVRDIVTHIGYLPDNPFNPDRLATVEAVKYICRQLKKSNQRFLFETGEELPLSLVHFFKEVNMDNIGVNFDPANLMMNGRGAHPATALEFLGDYICGFHAKDAKKPVPPELKKVEMPTGQGDVDFPALVAILKKIGYEGSLTIERESYGDPNRVREIAEIKRYLEALVGAEG